ncbi:Down syndrome cell adhesion molecule-like protein Dscam2 [Nymphon striatum]|nr:Down syndrome cell adhesion molecule-like protein Dscam2 [Nymphon striatum]
MLQENEFPFDMRFVKLANIVFQRALVATDESKGTGPIFIVEPPTKLAFLNTHGAVINCLVHGDPIPKIQWVNKNGKKVTDIDDLLKILANNSFREVHVTAVVDQHYSTQVYDEYVIEGNTAVLKCIIPSYIKDQIIVTAWIRDDGVRISSEYQQDSRYIILNRGDLNIFKVQYSDSDYAYKCQVRLNTHWCYQRYKGLACEEITNGAGKTIVGNSLIIRASMKDTGFYVCKAVNRMGEDKSTLKLTAPLSAFIHPQRQIVDIGQTINIGCVISGGPFTFVKWFKDGRFLKEDRNILNTSKSTMEISNVAKTTEGMYQCFVGNIMDEKQAIGQIILSGNCATNNEFKMQHRRPGQSVTLECAATGDPLPQIQWTLRDSLIKNNFGLNIESKIEAGKVWSKLTINILQISNGGIYKCIAKNKAGKDIYSNTLHVYGPPNVWPLINQTVVSGKSVFMQCHVSGYPVASISWKKGK